jgi:hypothetical protein
MHETPGFRGEAVQNVGLVRLLSEPGRPESVRVI